MRDTTNQMLTDLHASVAAGGSRGHFSNRIWDVTWYFGERRIEDKARENVFTFHCVTVHERYRGKGHFTELLRHLDQVPDLAGRRIAWIYIEQTHFRLAGHLERQLLYKSDFGMVIDCWRKVTGQLEMML